MSSTGDAHLSAAHEYILWILPFAFALHVVEERVLGFVPWAQRLLQPLGLRMEWSDFFMANAAVLVWGICAAAVGWRQPGFSLSFPVMMLWNPVFHVAASLVRMELSPGVFMGVLVYVPLSLWTLYGGMSL